MLTLPGGTALPALVASQAGVAVTGGDGQTLDAGWTRGAGQAIGWAVSAAADGAAVLVAGPPLEVRDVPAAGLPDAGRQRCGRWKVSASPDECPFAPGWRAREFLRLAGLSGWR